MEISKKILSLVKTDQSIRKKYWKNKTQENLQKMKSIDKYNRKEFKKILKEHKYIGIEYGEEVQEAAFLLVQHLPKTEIPLMRDYLKQMKKHINNVSTNNIALLTDRIRSWEGKKQYYGTQFTYQNGEYIIKPIWDLKNVNARRSILGLAPIEKYISTLEKEHHITISKKF